MIDKKYRELHNEYIKALVTYHNCYLKYIEGGKSKIHYPKTRQSLIALRKLNNALLKELLQVKRNKVEKLANENKYLEQRSRKKEK